MSRRSAAKALLENEDTCASVVYMSALALFRGKLQEFEYETLRLECRRMGIDIPEQNWEELYASLALRGDGRFMVDAATFENTIVAFNGDEVDHRQIQAPIPAHIAWGVREAGVIASDLTEDGLEEYFDYEPVSYAAAICKAHGMVCVPECLEFCEERLEELTPEHDDLRSEVKKAWAAQVETPAARVVIADDEVGVQLAHLRAIHEYVMEKTRQQQHQMDRLL